MCSDYDDDHGPICGYCGDSCYGECDNPDACRCCYDVDDDEGFYLDEQCMDEGCTCDCHEEHWADLDYRFEAGVLTCVKEHGLPYQRKGIFPFLKLPGEIRENIYGFAFLQDGKQRRCVSHRGSIHTALLGTCRQVNNEARHLPLTLNKLCFGSPLFAHDFLGFLLAPTQTYLVTGMNIEFDIDIDIMNIPDSSWGLLLRELAKMPISHLGLTIKGGVLKKRLLGNNIFTKCLKVLKGLKSFDLILASAYIKEQEKKDIQDEWRERLIKDYARPKEVKKPKRKRIASAEVVAGSRVTTKKAKKGNTVTMITASPESGRLGLKSQKPERDAASRNLLGQYNQLKQYATSLDSDAAPVKIRLEQARKAAEAFNETKFESLAHGILLTLEERYESLEERHKSIAAARKAVRGLHPLLPST